MDGVTSAQALAPGSTVINPHILAGCTALVVAVMLLLVYVYRRRLFILWGVGAWFLLPASMAPGSRLLGNPEIAGCGARPSGGPRVPGARALGLRGASCA